MLERRLIYFLVFLVVITFALLLRATQIQVIDGNYWSGRAEGLMQKISYSETTRGSILDFRGREIATDVACIDACVDYRAITREAEPIWLKEQALKRLRSRLAEQFRKMPKAQQKLQIEQEMQAVQADIESMWLTLAQVYRRQTNNMIDMRRAVEVIDDIRRSIEQKVEMRRRFIWYLHYSNALKEYEDTKLPWYKQVFGSKGADAPRLDSFSLDVAEQSEPHVVLRAIDAQTYNQLGKNLEQYPGLVLQASKHRVYPYDEAGCHLLGHLSRVNQSDLENDPYNKNPLREYWANDLIGRGGIENLAEQTLRGARGRIVRSATEMQISVDPAEAGKNVACTIDIDLQREIQAMFANAPITKPLKGYETEIVHREMHGAAVLIDVPTGQVRVLASYPTFNLNKLDDEFAELAKNDLDQKLFNRATQQALEPGSTVKPVIGLGAMTSGVLKPDERIECTGFLVLQGKVLKNAPRCWVASMFSDYLHGKVAHHPIPLDDHSPTGFLDLTEGLQRSCNVFFMTAADRLGLEGVGYWYDQFGLGRKTGIGITEAAGRSPATYRGAMRTSMTWYAGIGQGWVAATPLQMANVAATIARGGIWMRPTLLKDEPRKPEDVVDLHLSPEALRLVKAGMQKVVNTRAGSGYTHLNRRDLPIAAKSGSAQAAKFTIPKRDETGAIMKDPNGRTLRTIVEPSTFEHENPDARWYLMRGTDLTHSWFIGFAPVDKPQIAFAVLVEYAGSGGSAAAPMAAQVLEACVEHGYLSPKK